MVSFICDACQETVKKNKVDAHSWRCRNCWWLSCVDCGVRFEGEAYKEHTSCISEAEKYQGALYRGPKGATGGGPAGNGKGKKVDPQVRWTACMHEAKRQADSGELKCSTGAIGAIAKFIERGDTNVPRKRKKFGNFMQNTVHVRDAATIDETYALLMGIFKREPKEAPGAPSAAKETKAEKKKPEHSASSPTVKDAETKKKRKAKKTWKKLCVSEIKGNKKGLLKVKALHKMLEGEMEIATLKRKIEKSSKFEFVSEKKKRIRLAAK